MTLVDPFDLSDPTEYPALLERQRTEIAQFRGELAQCQVELEEAAKIIAGVTNFPSLASIYRMAAIRAKAFLEAHK